MKYILITILILGLVALTGLFLLGRYSQNMVLKQSIDSKLARCPQAANCVCSEYPQDAAHFIDAIDIAEKNQIIDLHQVAPLIINMGGEITLEQHDYLAAIFKSRLFGFVDDFELRLDPQNQKIQIRSASRVGRSDLGANKVRTDEFRQIFQSTF